MNILSLGAGVQSSTVFLMSCLGELPRLDHAIFADTGWEPRAVYDWLERLKEYGTQYGIPIHTVSAGNIREDNISAKMRAAYYKAEGGRWTAMPLRTRQQNGSEGIIKRQCTKEYKIVPIERFIKTEILGLPVRSRWPTTPVVRQWYGISADECRRMRRPVRRQTKTVARQGNLFGDSEAKQTTVDVPIRWKTHVYPLVGMELFPDRNVTISDKTFTRKQCLEWMASRGFPEPPRSACVGCPYRSNAEWLALSQDEFSEAVEFDESVRHSGNRRGKMYLHRDLVPLAEAKLDPAIEADMFCDEGLCGV